MALGDIFAAGYILVSPGNWFRDVGEQVPAGSGKREGEELQLKFIQLISLFQIPI